MTYNILGISGKKQSGKTTCGNFLFGCGMLSNGLVDYAEIDKEGNLVVPYESEDGSSKPCIFPTQSKHPSMVKYMSENLWENVKIYNFADTLKELCIDVLGLTYEQCYGTDEEKNSLTNINLQDCIFDTMRCRKMTAREVMQYVGTDFFRRIYPNVWVDSTIRKIKKDKSFLSVVVDCRFPNEIEGIKSAGGKVIRLTRNIFGDSDLHPSETALDKYEDSDCVIDNENMSISEQNESVYNQLVDWGMVNFSCVASSSQ